MASEEQKKPRRPPATTVEARENQLISDAYDLAEKQLRAGTASSQVISHFLKAGTTREGLERERLRRENILLGAKAEAMESAKRVEELYAEAIKAMRAYAGQADEEEYDD
jgi:hypothetical protein